MSADNKSVKIVLLLQPQKMLYRKPVVQLLKVVKDGARIEMDEYPITTATVGLYLKQLDINARRTLLKFSEAEIDNEQFRITRMLEKMKVPPAEADRFRDHATARYFQQHLSFLKQYSRDISWYHRVTHPDSNRVPTAPCTYHPVSVQLEFTCVEGPAGLGLDIMVKTREGKLSLDAFRRFYFLLLKDNQYYHLHIAAYEALEWLDEHSMEPYAQDKRLFLEKIVRPLQQKQQTVHMDILEERERIIAVPVNRLLLSELNNTFLMLTPQYVYDGVIIEGPFAAVTEKKWGDKTLLVQRDEAAEAAFTQMLRDLHPHFAKQYNGYFYLNFADAQKKQWFSKTYHQLLTDNVELVGMDMLRHFRYSPHQADTQVALNGREGEWLRISFKLSFGKEEVPLHELQKMLLNGQKVVLLKDGSMGVLGEDWLRQYGPVVKHSKIQNRKLMVPRWLAMSMDDAEGDAFSLRRTLPEDWVQRWYQWRQQDEAMYPLPPGITAEGLRPYQQKGYDWMNLMAEAGGSVCLADDMGLGKTLQTICFIANSLYNMPAGRHLVVCPASLIYNWQQEFEKFAAGIRTLTYHGAGRNADQLNDVQYQVIITSYGTLRQDIERFGNMTFEVAVIDESHHIKNPATQISRAVQELSSNHRIALSGTPVVNGTQDLYAQIAFLLPGLLGSREFFKKEYAIPIEQQRDEDKARELQRIIGPFILRRTKEQVAPDLPEKTETILWCTMGQDQRNAYETIKDNIRNSVLLDIEANGLNKGKMGVLAGLTKLRQICNSAELIKGEDLFTYDSIKTDVLIQELLNIIPAHKALVFSQFTGMLDLLERDLQKAGIRYQRLDGSTQTAKRQELVNSFQQENSDVQVFLLSLKAGNAGLTLTAADYVFLFDPWWNAAVENQAIDRTHRIGQQNRVFAYRLICKDTVEEKIIRLQQKKQKLAEDLVSTDDGFIRELTIDDIKYLLE